MFVECGVNATESPIRNTKIIVHKCRSKELNKNPLNKEPVVKEIQTIGKINDILSIEVFIITFRSIRAEA
jgi:hypothetical protein